MTDGYYWYRERPSGAWRVCLVELNHVYFFGQVNRRMSTEFVRTRRQSRDDGSCGSCERSETGR